LNLESSIDRARAKSKIARIRALENCPVLLRSQEFSLINILLRKSLINDGRVMFCF
jgi:hypothetical protein